MASFLVSVQEVEGPAAKEEEEEEEAIVVAIVPLSFSLEKQVGAAA